MNPMRVQASSIAHAIAARAAGPADAPGRAGPMSMTGIVTADSLARRRGFCICDDAAGPAPRAGAGSSQTEPEPSSAGRAGSFATVPSMNPWAPRPPITWPALLDTAPESVGIDLAEVRRYRLGRVREQ